MNSDKNTNSTPRLRFPGFTGEWEKKKLSDIFDRITDRNVEDIKNVLTISAQYGLVSQLDFFKKSVAASDVTGYYLLHKGDFAYNKSRSLGRPVGAIKPLKMYDKGVVSTLYICFRCKNPNEVDFWEQYFDAGIFDKEIMTIAQEGARIHGLLNVPINDFFGLAVLTPKPAEQEKISECLSAVDAMIAVQEKKVDSLKERKRGLMQQLFPLPGETDPLLRFPGFTGEWVKKKLANAATSFSGGTPKSSEPRYYGGTIPFIRSGEIHSTETALFITEEGLNNSSAKLVNKGDLLYALYGATSGDVAISKINGAINQAILCIRSKEINSCFLCNYLERIKETVTSRYLQGGQGNLSSDIIMSLTIPLPSLAEQEKIAMCLSEMETLITAESVRMEALKSHKRGLVQQLFPQSIK
ncbi:MAG: restriction endonuclease subunit S [Prevotella sp.]|nr:restriction endonuclease subunit S [Prevotella sp.]